MGCDDVLDGRAVLGFLKTKGVDQDLAPRNRRGHALEFGKLPARCREGLQYGRLVEAGGVEGREGGTSVI